MSPGKRNKNSGSVQTTVQCPGCPIPPGKQGSICWPSLNEPLYCWTVSSGTDTDRPLDSRAWHAEENLTSVCLAWPVAQEGEASLKSLFPNGYLLFRCIWTKLVPNPACLAYWCVFTADNNSCLWGTFCIFSEADSFTKDISLCFLLVF